MELNTPYFDEYVFENIPEILKRGCSIYESKRERDIFLISMLTTFGVFFPNVKGYYGGKPKFPNLYTFIIGPPASGKHAMINAKLAIKQIDEEFAKKIGLPEKYKPSISIPGNVSDSELINKLDAADGSALFFEPESDTIADSFKKDWAGYSDLWRKAAEHEVISKLRVSESAEISIDQPKLSICISGTPDQLPKLIPSVSNGLYSRFAYYIYDGITPFTNPGPSSKKVNYDTFYENQGKEFLKIYEYLNDVQLNFELGEVFFQDLTNHFIEWQTYSLKAVGPEFDSVVKRFGGTCFRIALTLSIIRAWETNTPILDTITCLPLDYYLAKLMISTLFHHSMAVFELFTKPNTKNLPTDYAELYNMLPKNSILHYKHIDEIWKDKMSPRTAFTRRKEFVEMGFLRHESPGHFSVIDLNNNYEG